jgi:hypothetical protein
VADRSRGRDEITVDGQDTRNPDVLATANQALIALKSPSRVVRGHLRSTQSKPDEMMQGMITTTLILDVTLIDVVGVTRKAFTVTSRGGGFTKESSALQAHERLLGALHERLEKLNL